MSKKKKTAQVIIDQENEVRVVLPTVLLSAGTLSFKFSEADTDFTRLHKQRYPLRYVCFKSSKRPVFFPEGLTNWAAIRATTVEEHEALLWRYRHGAEFETNRGLLNTGAVKVELD